MARVHRKLKIDRRLFLRGAGVSLALPWLDSMLPAFASTEDLRAAAPRRYGFVFCPNGTIMEQWTPKSKGQLKSLSKILEPLASQRKKINVISGLDLENGRALGDGPGDHARAAASFLTAAHPKKTGGTGIRNGVSVDQRLAQVIGNKTKFPSLEIGMERGRSAGVCDSGYACSYSNNISWRTPEAPAAKETHPRLLFARLFGELDDAQSRAEAQEMQRRQRSVLDFVREDAKSIRSKLGRGDRAKLDEYFDALRAVERRLSHDLEGDADAVAPPEGLRIGQAKGFPERLDLMYEILALAFQTDATRIASFMLGNAGSNRNYRFLGVPHGHHHLSHHGKDAKKMDQLAKISRFHMGAFAKFLDRLDAVEEGPRSLLDNSTLLFGAGLADPNRHAHQGLPFLVAGAGGGKIRGGRHLVTKKGTPAADLYLRILRDAGIRDEKFGDSREVFRAL